MNRLFGRIIRRTFCSKPVINYMLGSSGKGEKIIYLTFDDGPHPRTTEKLLDLLLHYNIGATFFVNGKNLESYPHIAHRIVVDGHALGNHTYSHNKPFNSSSYFENEILRCQKIIDNFKDAKKPMFRPPRGMVSMQNMILLKKNRFCTWLWSVDSMDYCLDKASVIKRLQILKEREIILFHDDSELCISALSELIPIWKEMGFIFRRLDR